MMDESDDREDTRVGTNPRAWIHTGYTQQIIFGDGALGQLGELLKSIGLRRVMLVTTGGRAASVDGEHVVRSIGRALASTFAEVTSHVPTPMVQSALRQARRDGVDGIVSFGGGSVADTAKAVCFFTEQEQGTPGSSFADRPVVPHVAITTTYSGAELTPFFGMTDPGTRQKSGAGGPTIAPIAAVYDPQLTLSTPARVSAETGMNALAHCVEVVWSPRRTPEAEALALAGARRIFDALPRVVADPDDLNARTDMLQGSILAGRSLANASMGVHHGLAQLLGGRTGIAHGLANAIVLPAAMTFNSATVPEAIAALSLAMGVDDAIGAVASLVEQLGLPNRLSDVGVSEADVSGVARLAPTNGNVQANPRPVSESDAQAILDSVF